MVNENRLIGPRWSVSSLQAAAAPNARVGPPSPRRREWADLCLTRRNVPTALLALSQKVSAPPSSAVPTESFTRVKAAHTQQSEEETVVCAAHLDTTCVHSCRRPSMNVCIISRPLSSEPLMTASEDLFISASGGGVASARFVARLPAPPPWPCTPRFMILAAVHTLGPFTPQWSALGRQDRPCFWRPRRLRTSLTRRPCAAQITITAVYVISLR